MTIALIAIFAIAFAIIAAVLRLPLSFGLVAGILCGLAVITAGCQHAIVTGGGWEDHSNGLEIDQHPDGTVAYRTWHSGQSTTQPSADAFGSMPNTVAGKGPNDPGGFSFAQMKAPNTGNIVLGIIGLLAAGIFAYFFKNYIYAAISLAVGVAAFLMPTTLGIVAIGCLVLLILFHSGTTIQRLVVGVQKGLGQVPSDDAATLKTAMATVQSPADQATVKALKPTAA